ncbi:MAG: FKBP-type peptidyl-prolyl cis-trans isomerase [Akkermansia sp.]|nr:FKBP-type peptidyl-prolyl cis-trans isomerase [Akkermansia sp.]MDO5464543.1 FKBP-type peptidyl-prolyl cis-trans isomerase [Akkermansia sp.]
MTDQDKMKKVMGYLIGYRLGSQMLPQMLPGIEADDVVAETLAKGVKDGISGDMDMSLIDEKVEEYQNAFVSMLQERGKKVGEANLEKGRLYMAENGKRPEVTTTESGLQYEVLVAGGSEKYDPAVHGDAPTAEVMYKGTLVDGTVFDQSRQPVKFNIRQVIPGFTEALKLMPVGAKWKVTIPANLAYGANGPGSIGPNSTLIFEMELLGLTK